MKTIYKCLLVSLAAAAVIWLLARRDGKWADETEGHSIYEGLE